MKNARDIHILYSDRMKDSAAEHAAMRSFEDFIKDRIPVPLVEFDRSEQSAIANLATQGLTQLSQRAGSVVPRQIWPAVKDGFKEHEERARTRMKAGYGWWERNDIQGILTLRSEHLFGHAIGPVSVLPNPATGIATWRVREPLTVFPAPCANPLEVVPPDCIVAYKQSWAWLQRTYGDRLVSLKRNRDCKPDEQFTVIEFIDDMQISTCVLSDSNGYNQIGSEACVEVDYIPNRAERPLVFVPSIYGLGGRRAKFSGSQGIHQMRAKILALAFIAASKGANPDLYLQSDDPNTEPEILTPFDPRTGEPGVVTGGRIIPINVQPSAASMQMLSVLEREMRLAGGIPAAFGAEAASTVQTGRMASDLTSNAIDYPIMQAQQRFERSCTEELKAATAIVKKWTPGKRSIYVGWPGAVGHLDYTEADFDSDEVRVRYPVAGSDLSNSLLRGEQKVATGAWSRQTFRENDPETMDPEGEHDRVTAETIERAILDEFLQPGSMDVTAKAKVMIYVRQNKLELAEAIDKVHQEEQEKQAAAAQAEAGAPEAQSGINALPPAVAGGAPPIPQGPPALGNLSASLAQLGAQAPRAA